MFHPFKTILILTALLPFLPAEAGVSVLGKVILAKEGTGISNAVVWLEIAEHQPSRELKIESMVQKGKELHPKVLVAPTNTEVYFPNQDPIFHNIFSFNKVKKLDLGNYKGKGNPVIFGEPGVYPIGCSIHPWMSAYIVIVSSPFFSKSGAGGDFTLKDLKVGTHTFFLWNPDFKETQTREVNLIEGVNNLKWEISKDQLKRKRKKRSKRKKKSSYSGY
ncbi:hypothetical protein HOF92_06750 [bacterium]|jgi:hypothetical protein|nr:hypothetical protein [bacterium]